MINKAVIGAVALALGSGAAQAGDNQYTKEEGTGMFAGAAAGALVGGPVGAAVGFMFGGILGDRVGAARLSDERAQLADQRAQVAGEHARQLEQELQETRAALAEASESNGGDEMLDALAKRLHADVLFRTGGADMSADVAGKLEALGQLLGAHAQMEVQLHGFADPRGNAEKNLELSLQRASAVRDALIRGGASPEQIQVMAHGEDLTTAQKGDLEAYAWERRVSLSIRPNVSTTVAQSQ